MNNNFSEGEYRLAVVETPSAHQSFYFSLMRAEQTGSASLHQNTYVLQSVPCSA